MKESRFVRSPDRFRFKTRNEHEKKSKWKHYRRSTSKSHSSTHSNVRYHEEKSHITRRKKQKTGSRWNRNSRGSSYSISRGSSRSSHTSVCSRGTSWSSHGRRTSSSVSRSKRRGLGKRSSYRRSFERRQEDSHSWRRTRRRHDKEGYGSNLDYYKEPIRLSVIALRRVPITLTENDLESAIRSTAISVGFSPPNFIKLLSLENTPNNTSNTTSAYVQFPSCDSAQGFYDACRKNFQVKCKQIYLEIPQCPPARLNLLTSSHTPSDWAAVIDPVNDHRSLGLGIPYPNLKEFVMDSKSGLLFSEKAGLFYDMANQQFISFNGVYYVKSVTTPYTLVPIQDLAGSTSTTPSALITTMKAKILNESSEQHEKEEDTLLVPHIDSATTKASAVASVLATAQLAAKATKRVVKPKLGDGMSALGTLGTPSDKEHAQTAGSSIRKDYPEVLTIESVFGDAVVEEELKIDQLASKENKENISNNEHTSNFYNELIQAQQFICFVCIQQFKDANHLSKHQTESLLHQKNCKLQNITNGAV
ncbi:uncharacterized protein LOC128883717 [Hylaeus volcanicus]|uniref:uncharacterized protein LOC128883717 n=1 Tax=Hylaeus volcanicus TaxID=313075 RepID=UPI0023B7E086|nr:uncharacterized protein LOC128883717 [Hylaeus volcanicus]